MLYFSKSTNGFYNSRIHKYIPPDAVEITPEEHKRLLDEQSNGGIIEGDANGYPQIMAANAIPSVFTCNAYQFYRALDIMGLRAAVVSAIAASNDQELIDAFNKAPAFTSNHPKIIAMANAIGKTEADIKALFELAITINL